MLSNGCRARIVSTRIALSQQIIIRGVPLCRTSDYCSRLFLSTACRIGRGISTGAMAKRKGYSTIAHERPLTTIPIPGPFDHSEPPPAKRRASRRKVSQPKSAPASTNPEENVDVLDGPEALRASPDADEEGDSLDVAKAGMDVDSQVKVEENRGKPPEDGTQSDSTLSEISDMDSPAKNYKPNGKVAKPGVKEATETKVKATAKEPQFLDPEAEGDEEADEEEIQAALSRPPPVNSDYLPLPWKGRIGYVGFRESRGRKDVPAHSSRPASVHTYAFQILLCSLHAHAASHPSSRTDIL